MRKIFLGSIALVTILACGSVALADTWSEVGDAGNLPATAQVPTGANPLTAISGSIASSGDADMYLIFISSPATFSATTVGTGGSLSDTQLFLFTAAGLGVYANDDDAACLCTRSMLPAGHALSPTTPGLYYLAISSFDTDPSSPGGLIFPSSPFTAVQGPTGPGGGSAVSSWAGSSGSGTYTINLTGAGFAGGGTAVPEPTTMLLLGTGLAGVASRVRQRRKSRS
jgi:hypothetical protein